MYGSIPVAFIDTKSFHYAFYHWKSIIGNLWNTLNKYVNESIYMSNTNVDSSQCITKQQQNSIRARKHTITLWKY